MAINPRPAGTRPAPSKKTRPAPPRLCNRVSGRVFKLKRVFNRVLTGRVLLKNPNLTRNIFLKTKNLKIVDRKGKWHRILLSSSRSSAARSSVSDFEEDEFRFASESVSEVERVSIVVDLVAWCLWLWVFGVRIGARFVGGCGFDCGWMM
jgi:hypothetical protein